jgi:hypothetical protein
MSKMAATSGRRLAIVSQLPPRLLPPRRSLSYATPPGGGQPQAQVNDWGISAVAWRDEEEGLGRVEGAYSMGSTGRSG